MATSLDARDVLNLPQDGGSGQVGGRPAKKQKMAGGHALGAGAMRNLKGLAREVQSLGGETPISIVPQIMSNIKKRRLASRKPAARWEMRPFTNSAREDNTLVLRHWRRKVAAGRGDGNATHPAGDTAATTDDGSEQTDAADGAAAQPGEDSAFAKYNVKVSVPQYTDDQYDTHLQNPNWTKEETDYLMGLVRDFDLRWPLIWDRYDYHALNDGENSAAAAQDATALVPVSANADGASRGMEDLKTRYYEVAAKMMALQKPAQYMTQSEYNLHNIMASFSADKERQRKAFATNALMRSREEVREEEALLFEVRRIMDRTDRTNEERRELYSRLEFPHSEQDISTFKTSAGLQTLLQNLVASNDRSRKRRSLAGGEAGSPAVAGVASAGGSGADGAGRRDGIAVAGGASGHNRRESGVGVDGKAHAHGAADGLATPATPQSATPLGGPGGGKNKKGGPQAERRKLTAQEQEVYGVTYHERLGSGPTFRYEKINKLFTHKSGQQQMRITNILNELEMPARLFMPTASVTGQFEQLVNGVVQLVDLRKVSDKLDGEIKIEEQRKAERDKAKGIVAGSSSAAKDSGSGGKRGAAAAATAADKAGSSKAGDGAAGSSAAVAGALDAGDKFSKAEDGTDDSAAAKKENGDDGVESKTDEEAKEDKKAAATKDELVPTKEEGGGDNEIRTRSGSRPGSSSNGATGTAHKRSASVLSAASDKSSKRQKK